jgi:hypothetical protein
VSVKEICLKILIDSHVLSTPEHFNVIFGMLSVRTHSCIYVMCVSPAPGWMNGLCSYTVFKS